jgi:DNA-directed RNA polymerase subunit RPC12/RpoP
MRRSDWRGATIVYEYGCRDPGLLPEEALRQLMLQDDLWASLCSIERRHRESVRALTLLHPDAEAAEARRRAAAEALAAERQRIKDARRAQRGRIGAGVPDQARIAALRDEVAAATAAAKEARRAARDELRPALAELEQARYRAVQDARRWFSARGLYWGSSGAVIDAYEAARQRAILTGAELRPRNRLPNGAWDPNGDGSWTVQIQTESGCEPLRADGLFGFGGRVDEKIRIAPAPWSEHAKPRMRTTVTVRIRGERAKGPDGWADLGEPVHMTLPVTLHRPIPPEAQIVRAQVVRRRVAERHRYSLCLTLRVPAAAPADLALPAVGVDVGWRPMPDGSLRVAYAVAEDGWIMDVRTPALDARRTLRTGMELADQLRARQDQHFNEARAMLTAWLAARGEQVPDWLRDETEHLAQWRSHDRMHALLRHWRRFPGDQEIHAALTAWAERDRHLHRWEDGGRRRWLLRRREAYRIAAAEIARRASAVVLEAFDLRAMARARPVESDDGSDTALRRVMREAAPGEFRSILRQACAARGVRVVEVPAEYSTRTCPDCGQRYEADFAASVWVACPHCGQRHDQDEAAARNLLRRASEPVAPEE